MAADRSLLLTDDEALLERVMSEVIARVQGMDYVLKGGGALVFAYGIGRHSTDLDFDAIRPIDLTRRVRKAAEATGVVIDKKTWWSPPNTGRIGVSRRLKVKFAGPSGKPQELQIDIRYRPRPISEDIVILKGTQTYKPEALFRQKIAAFKNRNEARDFFDLAFIARKYGNDLSDDQIRDSETITRDMDSLERKLEYQLNADKSLARITTAVDIVCEFREAVDEQSARRGLFIQQQAVPISHSMVETIRGLREILRGPEANMPRPRNLSAVGAPDKNRSRHRDRGIDRDRWFSR